MRKDMDKTVIRIIQDYCFNSDASVLSNEFVLTVSPLIVKFIEQGELGLGALRKILQKRKDFFIANDLDITAFCKGLHKKLNYEISFYTGVSQSLCKPPN